MKRLSLVLSSLFLSAVVAAPAMAASGNVAAAPAPVPTSAQQQAVALADAYTLQGMLQMAYGDREINLLRYLGNQPAGVFGMLMDTHLVAGKKGEKVITFVPAVVLGTNIDMGNLLQAGVYMNFGIINGTLCDACENATPAVDGGKASARHQSFSNFGVGLFAQKSIYNHFVRGTLSLQYISYTGNDKNNSFASARYAKGSLKGQKLPKIQGDQSGVNVVLTLQGGRTVPVNNWYLVTPMLQYQLDTLSLNKDGRITLNRVGFDVNNTFLINDNFLMSAGLGLNYQWASTPNAQVTDANNYKVFAFDKAISGHLPTGTASVNVDLNATWRINPKWTVKVNLGWKHYFAAKSTSSNYALGASYFF